MSPTRYRIVNSQDETERFRSLLAEAVAEGRADAVLAAARRLFHRLSLVPLDVGEAREELPSLGLSVRIDFEGPLMVGYAVHEESRTVFIRYVRYIRRPAN
jgi:hypothetical protein